MKVGIISDTHDDVSSTRAAIKIFEDYNVGFVIHCGDYVFPPIVKEFEKLTTKGVGFVGVLGNNDGERNGIVKTFVAIRGLMLGEIGELEIDGLKFCVYHGTDNELRSELISSGKYDVFVSGHTHKKEPTSEEGGMVSEKTIVINPGSAHRVEEMADERNLFSESTVAVFDTVTKTHKFVNLSQTI